MDLCSAGAPLQKLYKSFRLIDFWLRCRTSNFAVVAVSWRMVHWLEKSSSPKLLGHILWYHVFMFSRCPFSKVISIFPVHWFSSRIEGFKLWQDSSLVLNGVLATKIFSSETTGPNSLISWIYILQVPLCKSYINFSASLIFKSDIVLWTLAR